MAELAFEKFGAPALYFSSTAVLSAFACGKATGLVIDSGSSVTSVVPVYEGYALKKGIRKQALAGDYISDCIIEGLERQYKYQITPPYQIQSRTAVESGEQPKVVLKPQPAATESYHKAKLQMAVSEFKESTCQVFETLYDKDQVASRPGKPYEFHDGFNTIFGSERYKFPEVLFQPDLLSGQSSDFMGLHHLALDSVASCDVELRPHLLSNIVATGGTTLFPGFIDRLSVELASSAYGVSYYLSITNFYSNVLRFLVLPMPLRGDTLHGWVGQFWHLLGLSIHFGFQKMSSRKVEPPLSERNLCKIASFTKRKIFLRLGNLFL
ncbi:NuA4 histone acetyltransferase subunit, variant 2 [Entomophthora muscae]|uniref:NuA4 histone acetyltransferase subunit, variant 2 n=1 Tax=Entomophthora muscae TaxID=34485 RepID=A0ACC2TWP3_9FUNG|nr:NuA4 histone acetyltransferase subunit, variant 2 [Entomophthora muscae]